MCYFATTRTKLHAPDRFGARIRYGRSQSRAGFKKSSKTADFVKNRLNRPIQFFQFNLVRIEFGC
jgi:hypothetical protein